MVGLSAVVFLLMLPLIAQSGFNLSPLVSPDTAGQTMLLYALSTLNFLAFITLFFVLLRNILKLVRERRAGRLGSKFKARLVIQSIALSFLPVLLLFFFAFGLINRSVDRWFGEPTKQIVEDSHILEDTYFERDQAELTSVAGAIGRALTLDSRQEFKGRQFQILLRKQMNSYRLALVRVVANAESMTVENGNIQTAIDATLQQGQKQIEAGASSFVGKVDGANSSLLYAVAGIRTSSERPNAPILLVAQEFPRAANIDDDYKKLDNLRLKNKGLKDRYVQMLALVTLLLIFASVWWALYVARGITVPILALAEATDRVARGEFSQRVEVEAEDELAALVKSFNQMASQLAENREQLEAAAGDLRNTNLELLDRKRYIETVLDSLSTGVISTDDRTAIATINDAAVNMLGLKEKPAPGTPVKELVPGPEGDELYTLCRRARRAERAHADIEFPNPDSSPVHTATTAIALRRDDGAVSGWVIVIEDLTDLVQAERAAAWSEVARRMAHEIKNPLTPIQLSAERIIRNYKREASPGSTPKFNEVVTEGTSTIIREVGALQRMVEEFSRFARLPESRPVQSSLNDLVDDAVKLYADRLDGVRMDVNLDKSLPELSFDPEQMKR
ncbi:MAG: HAMP domain-containing protein, partial [Blastocatellia bacterium]